MGFQMPPAAGAGRTAAGGGPRGPHAGLELLDALDADGSLAGHHRLDAIRAHLLEMAGDR